jgi:hypothetical protein
MLVAYGIDVLPSNDPHLSLAYEAVQTLSNAGILGKYLVVGLMSLTPGCIINAV